MKAILLSFAIILTGFSLNAQTGAIKGTVVSKDGSPLPSAHILIKDRKLVSFTTDLGAFELKNIPAGLQAIRVSIVGFETQEIQVMIQENQTLEMNLTLTESAHQLNEVVVKGSQGINERATSIGKVAINPMDLPQSIMVISNEQLVQQQTLHMADVLMNTN